MNTIEKNHLPLCRSLQSESPSVQAPTSQSCGGGGGVPCLVLPPSNRGLYLRGTLPGNLRLLGKNVRFTDDRLHKHHCSYSCAKNGGMKPNIKMAFSFISLQFAGTRTHYLPYFAYSFWEHKENILQNPLDSNPDQQAFHGS